MDKKYNWLTLVSVMTAYFVIVFYSNAYAQDEVRTFIDNFVNNLVFWAERLFLVAGILAAIAWAFSEKYATKARTVVFAIIFFYLIDGIIRLAQTWGGGRPTAP